MPITLSRTRLAVAAATAAVLAAGAPAAYAALDEEPVRAAAQGQEYIETRLFFGTARPDGGPAVADRQFSGFIDRYVTPAFPDGLTVQGGQGQWRDAGGIIERERSYELILIYPATGGGSRDRSIETIRTTYKLLYGQESVARLDETVRADF
ncbi:DUF3574 domain-containing protein [Streptomyces sp. NPDC054841]